MNEIGEAILERSRFVLHHMSWAEHDAPDEVTFALALVDDVIQDHHVSIPKWKWEEMGEPDRITVTVQPGDRLNDNGES